MTTQLTPPPAANLAARPTDDLAIPGLDQSPALVYLAQLSPGSRRTMRQALNTIAEMLGQYDAASCPWHRLRYAHTTAIRTQLADRYAPATANKMLSALRRVLEECWRLGLMTAEEHARASDLPPVSGFHLPAGRALSYDELDQLIRICAADSTPAGARDAAIIAVLAGCGLRRSELASLERKHLDLATGELLVRSGKGNKDRRLYLPAGTSAALHTWLAERGDAPGPLFTSGLRGGHTTDEGMTDQAVLSILQRRAEQAGVAAFSPHDLRRTYITRLLAAGIDLATVQQLAGHSDPKTTARYDRRGEEAKRAAADALSIPISPSSR